MFQVDSDVFVERQDWTEATVYTLTAACEPQLKAYFVYR